MREISRSRISRTSLWLAAVLATAVAPVGAQSPGPTLSLAPPGIVDPPPGGAALEVVPKGAQRAGPAAIPRALDEAVRMVLSDFRVREQYEYVMTGEVRFLLFWIGRDDVGDGRISVEDGIERSELHAIRLKIGSNPAKAPRGINRWGAAAEVIERDAQSRSVVSTAFFGFMKATEGESVDAVEAELASEGTQQRHVFKASINRIEHGVAYSSVLPIVSPVDFHIGQMAQAEQMVRDQYERAFRLSSFRRLNGEGRRRCERNASFLFTLKESIDAAVAGRISGYSRCFVYNSELLTLTLVEQRSVARRQISYELVDGSDVLHGYRDLIEMEFELGNQTTGWSGSFELLVGTTGNVRGVPVRITYQPNFWFKAILNLHHVTARLARPEAEGR